MEVTPHPQTRKYLEEARHPHRTTFNIFKRKNKKTWIYSACLYCGNKRFIEMQMFKRFLAPRCCIMKLKSFDRTINNFQARHGDRIYRELI